MNLQIIRSTDHDALSCRYSIASKQYIKDPYISNIVQGFQKFLKFDNKSPRRVLSSLVKTKFPVINRGTYIRIKSIDIIIENFLEKFNGRDVRIINLGAGSDTRSFSLAKQHNNLDIIEVDFPDSIKFKKAIILDDKELAESLDIPFHQHSNLDEFYKELSNEGILASRYQLLPFDLRNSTDFGEFLRKLPEKPTLILSECMLCYLSSDEADKLLLAIHRNISQGVFVVYDPLGGDDSFGNVMIDNLKMRNLSLDTLLKYNTLEKYQERFRNIGFQYVKIDNLFNILNNWLAPEDLKRIARLEFLDEIEELKLLLEHYCLCLSHWGLEFETNLIFQL
ncbi:hypothetical protein WICMUC_005096 [Wickerhamomyces mucosus]|uniref:Leucine carboxyl methyltransferase 1 n=1 Tax=Wickerhamomyces mucosus TaxID=1378264 RepID=A0A9P8PD74_9ASCO|nr:hypothetical protein WICMUC_005096 [Wickerhamomyces mucosus]